MLLLLFHMEITFCSQKSEVLLNNIYIQSIDIDGKTYIDLDKAVDLLGGEKSMTDDCIKVNINKSTQILTALNKVSPSVVSIIGSMRIKEFNNYNRYIENVIHGTGVVVNQDGLILTNNHVIENMDNVIVVLSSGKGYEAEVKCIDDMSDLALIKIKADNLTPVNWNEDIDLGKEVLAVGTPVSMELRNSATLGIISGINRGSNSSYYLIQTDAAINPGNSGGPLLDLDGNVLGINSSKYIGYGVEGIGFSIPAKTVRYFLNQYYSNGKIIHVEIGALLKESWESTIGLPSNKGLFVKEVKYNIKEDLKVGDEILSINNEDTYCLTDYYEEMKKYKPGDNVTVKIKRNNIIFSTSVTINEKI